MTTQETQLQLAPLLPDHGDAIAGREALRFGERALTHAELRAAAVALARELLGAERVAVWAAPELETAVAVVAALLAGVSVVPINPKTGESELGHILGDAAPSLVLTAPEAQLPAAFDRIPRHAVDVTRRGGELPPEADPAAPAVVVYTSGTTGPPKGAVLPRRAIASNLDGLARAWSWTDADVLVHALPLYHVHGLVLGVLGPVRLGGSLLHLGGFSTAAVADALAGPATMLFGVPTMYHRLVADAESDSAIADALRGARLLVSGSAPLPAADHKRIAAATGQKVVERYGMTETLMNTAVRADAERRPGTVGPALDGVELRIVDDGGGDVAASDHESVGEILVRGPNLFLHYLNRPDATREAFADGWFRTGDMASWAPGGYVKIIGRQSTDLIKSGGYKIGTGEIEAALLEHPGVAEVAVTGEPDPDLGERIVAWVVPAGADPPADRELADHVARLLSPHKRPRVVHHIAELPRNALGKVLKRKLGENG